MIAMRIAWVVAGVLAIGCGGKDSCIEGVCPAPCDKLAYVYGFAFVVFVFGAVFFALLRRAFAEAI